MGDLPIAARRHPLIAAVRRNLVERCGVDPANPQTIVLGVSGGADSMALLLAMLTIGSRRGVRITPVAVHVNHGLRQDSDRDATCARAIAALYEVPFEEVAIDVSGETGNTYDCARTRRYRALAQCAAAHGAKAVAVAHHADDQFETILMHLCRGCEPRSLAGMGWRRPLAEGVDLIRPLLNVQGETCESLCRVSRAEWIDDPANTDAARVRARLRRDVVPVLEELWPGAAARSARLADTLHDMQAVIDDAVADALPDSAATQWSRTALRERSPIIVAAGLHRAATQHGVPRDALGRERIDEVMAAIRSTDVHRRSFHWPGNLEVIVTSKEVRLQERDEASSDD